MLMLNVYVQINFALRVIIIRESTKTYNTESFRKIGLLKTFLTCLRKTWHYQSTDNILIFNACQRGKCRVKQIRGCHA